MFVEKSELAVDISLPNKTDDVIYPFADQSKLCVVELLVW